MSIEEVPSSVTKPPGASYEFNEGQNRVFAGLAKKVRIVGFWTMLYGGLQLLGFVYGLVPKQRVEIKNEAAEASAKADVRVDVPRFNLSGANLVVTLDLGAIRYGWSARDLTGAGDVNVNVDLGAMVSGLVFLMMGIWSRRAASGFQAVATTQGSDIGHLMGALGEFSKLYGLLRFLITVVVIFVAVVMGFLALGLLGAILKGH